jgi:hypothetical protein
MIAAASPNVSRVQLGVRQAATRQEGDLEPGLRERLGHLEIDLACLGHPLRSVENLERNQVTSIVVIETASAGSQSRGDLGPDRRCG